MQVECRVILFTMPRRRRFKPRIDCVAILGKLSSAIVLWFTHKPNSYCLGLKSRLCRLCLHSSPNPSFDKGGMRGFASSIFISHPKPLPLAREGLVASVPLASFALGIMGKLGIVGNWCVILGAHYQKLADFDSVLYTENLCYPLCSYISLEFDVLVDHISLVPVDYL